MTYNPGPLGLWCERMKTDPSAVAIADRHYSRQSPGTKQFMPPGANHGADDVVW